MNDTFGDRFNASTSAGDQQSKSKSVGIAPVFIDQILRAPEGNFELWGITYNIVTTVAIVRSIETSSTKITYLLEDHTGKIEGHYWLEEDTPNKTPNLMINGYARVYGSIRQHSGNKTLMIFHMSQLADGPNELSTHRIEVYFARYKAEKYSQKRPDDFSNARQDADEASYVTGLTPKQAAVQRAVKNFIGSDCGISYMELSKQVTCPENELRKIVEFLVTEGIIYTTIDADHFLSA